MPDRIAFRMNLNPGQAAEYERRHDEIFPELVTLLKEVGISDYTIWLDPEDHHLFAILTRSDDHKLDRLPDEAVMKRWWAFMGDIMAINPDSSPVQVPLKRVFYLA
ncbi:L-rhamnose mutarotase [Labrys neptuniae]|uniref:L-rhamnose mutarotase n=1 Tax=Labrys neptuniae TaxID=376174 RepID=A0ABV3PJ60_9HYPH